MPASESVVLETSLGNIQLELYWDHAPRVRPFINPKRGTVPKQTHGFLLVQTCENFAQLAKRGYYNGVIFHRIVAVCPPPPPSLVSVHLDSCSPSNSMSV